MAPRKEPSQYTTAELKAVLRSLNLSSTGNKSELINRLTEASSDVWENMADLVEKVLMDSAGDREPREENNSTSPTAGGSGTSASENDLLRREIELLKREKSLLEREVQVLSREHQSSSASMGSSNGRSVRSYVGINNIGGLLNEFQGDDGVFMNWKKQVELLQRTYELDEDSTKILIGSKLKGRAMKWFYSKPDHLELTANELLEEMSTMFDHRPNRLALRREFEQRHWQNSEVFADYFHEKIILANRVPIDDGELVDYLIDGISDTRLRDQARVQCFQTKSDLFEAFKKITITARPEPKDKAEYKNKDSQHLQRPTAFGDSSRAAGRRDSTMKCFNCSKVGHLSTSCPQPKRERGACFGCGATDHRISTCPKKNSTLSSTTNLVQSSASDSPYTLPVKFSISSGGSILNYEIVALIDTGSPVSIIKSSYVPIDARIPIASDDFNICGINGSKLVILGLFVKDIYVHNIKVNTKFLVVPDETMAYMALLGRDFIAGSPLNLKLRETFEIIEADRASKPKDEAEFDKQLLFVDISDQAECISDVLNINPNMEFEIANELRVLFTDIAKSNFEPAAHTYEMTINLKHNQPISFRPRRLSFAETEKLRIIIDGLSTDGIIRSSNSPYASPIVLVRKKNGEIRLCTDFREINKITVKDNFPTPHIDDLLDKLKNKRYFSKLDLKNGFFHVGVAEDSRQYTSFVTPFGQFEYLKMPFGLTNAPREFQRFTSGIFRTLIDQNKLLLYFDDLLIATGTIEEHFEILKEVFVLARKYGLEFRFDKCSFLYSEITYLGYLINEEGIRPSGEHIESLANFPVPRTARQVHQFVGLASYFRRFIRDFSLCAKPLYDSINKSEFSFGPTEFEAFETLKSYLVAQPILAIYSPKLQTELHCDASASGYGAILMQKQANGKLQPVSYFSRRTTPTESKYHSFELECLAVVYAIKRFHVYLFGIPFKILTDCDSFRLTLNKQSVNPRISRWAMFLQSYDYQVEHRPGSRMKHVDALSRCHSICILEANSLERTLLLKQDQDKVIQEIRKRLELSEDKCFELRDGLVYRKVRKGRLLFYVPESMETNIIRTCHDDVGHVGVEKVVTNITSLYWFPKIRSKVKVYTSNCLKCIEFSPASGKREGFLHGIPKGSVPFNTIHVDHCGPFEKTGRGNRHILSIVDGFTKYIRLYACKTVASKETISHLRDYFRSYGRPRRIVSDRGTCFTSDEFGGFSRDESISHVCVAVGTPRANGQVERFNRVITPMLGKIVEDPRKWDIALPSVEYAINNTTSRSTGETPSRLLFGIEQNGPVNDKLKLYLSQGIIEDRNLEEIRESASRNIDKIQTTNERYYNSKHKAATVYAQGDYVMIRNIDTTVGVNKKLIPKFKGPYVVKEVLDQDRYIVSDIEGFQLTQRPYQGTVGPDQMKYWTRNY